MKSRIIPTLQYHDAKKAIQWLCDAFGFESKAVYEGDNGKVMHAELTYKGNMIMLGSTGNDTPYSRLIKHPSELDGYETQSPYIIIDDDEMEAHYARAKEHGAKIALDLKSESYGGKSYTCFDLERRLWNFGSYDPWKSY